MRKRFAEAMLRKVFALSGNQCAFPGCTQKIVDDRHRIIGVICHIRQHEGKKTGSTRLPPKAEAALFDNILLLCPTHYKLVENSGRYPAVVLREMKAAQEEKYISNPYQVSDIALRDGLQLVQATAGIVFTDLDSPRRIETGSELTSFDDKGIRKDIAVIFTGLYEDNFPKLERRARKTADENKEKFEKVFFLEASQKLTDTELNRFYCPDVQYITWKALEIAARKDKLELREGLASLLVQRIRYNGDELRRNILDASIETIARLTPNQMKILTLSWLLKNSCNSEIRTMNDFNQYLNRYVKPFLNFHIQSAEFHFISFLGCGFIEGSIRYDLVRLLKNQYSGLFTTPIDPETIEEIQLPEELHFILGVEDDGSYYIKFMNRKTLEEFLRQYCQDESIITTVTDLYHEHLLDNESIRRKIITETDLGEELLRLWEASKLKNLNLTPVGLTLAATYFEQITGGNNNITNWLK